MKIASIHAFIATEDDGGEGVCAFKNIEGNWVPLIAADETRLEQLRTIAAGIAADMKVNITLAKFSTREDIEVLHGKAPD